MQQQVNATVRIIFSADAELDREELEARVRGDVAPILGKRAPRDPAKLEAQSWELLELQEEATIYGPTSAELLARVAELERRVAVLEEAGDVLAEAIDNALETHIHEPGEVPPDCGELLALEAWRRLRELTDATVAPYETHAARLRAEGYCLRSDLDRFDVYRAPGGRRAWINYQGGDDRFVVLRGELEGAAVEGATVAELELGRRLKAVQA